MDEIRRSVEATRGGDLAAFGVIVTRFQDMALGTALSILKDLQLAEDAAQEAFICAWLNLDALRDPDRLAGWLRQIVFTQCNRIQRRRRPESVEPARLESIADRIDASSPGADEALEQAQTRQLLATALSSLPEIYREALALFYIAGHSYSQVADLLEVPISTVKKRLHDGRRMMSERIQDMTDDEFQPLRPSRSEHFTKTTIDTIRDAVAAVGEGDLPRLDALLHEHPALVASAGFDTNYDGTYFAGATLLHYIAGNPTDHPVPANACEVARRLIAAGADPNAMTAVGRNTPLCLVASGKATRDAGVQIDLIDTLVEAGAEVDVSDGLAIYAALIHGETEAAAALRRHGAQLDLRFAAGLGDVTAMEQFVAPDGSLTPEARRSHRRRPYYEDGVRPTANELPEMTHEEMLVEALAYAVANDQLDVARWLLAKGADVRVKPSRFHGGQSVLHVACTSGAVGVRDPAMVELLLEAGADPDEMDPGTGTPTQWAVHNNQPELIRFLLGHTSTKPDDHMHHAISRVLESGDADRRDRALQVLAMLREAGADLRVARSDGQTAAQVIEGSGDPELQRLLVDWDRRQV